MPDYIHIHHGDNKKRSELMALLNQSFNFQEEHEIFENLLPKLYKKEYHPAENNILLEVDGEMRAAVGLYYGNLTVCGETLKMGGIGNVACHPDYRANGYMRFCMSYALDEMQQNMTDFSYLSGKRQRYERYGFEPAGQRYEFFYNEDNVTRKFGRNKKSAFCAKKIAADDFGILEKIAEIYGSKDFKAERPVEKMYDILRSWRGEPYAVFDGTGFKGWFVLNSNHNCAYEIGYQKAADIEEIVLCALETAAQYSIKITVPPFDQDLTNYLSLSCEYYQMSHPDQYNIFCYQNVIRAFLKLKNTYQKLPDGECTLRIEGEKLPEQFTIAVHNGMVTTQESNEAPDLVLTHPEAMRLVGSLYSERRNELKPACAAWFPLPLFTYSQDNV